MAVAEVEAEEVGVGSAIDPFVRRMPADHARRGVWIGELRRVSAEPARNGGCRDAGTTNDLPQLEAIFSEALYGAEIFA
jgi:hypothetical protein